MSTVCWMDGTAMESASFEMSEDAVSTSPCRRRNASSAPLSISPSLPYAAPALCEDDMYA